MLNLLYSFIWWFKLKPPILMEENSHKGLEKSVQCKLFSQENLGRAILFNMYNELGNEELIINASGQYESRYSLGRKRTYWCWSVDLLSYILINSLNACNSDLQFKNRIDAREFFYLTFGEDLKAQPAEKPEVGFIVLFPNLSKDSPKIGIVSRILRNKDNVIKKWWYIAGNEGIFVSHVKESRGDNKNIEGFMDISEIHW